LTYTLAELCWALGISKRQYTNIKWKLPKPLDALKTKQRGKRGRPLWSREQVDEWVRAGCPKPK
jgi:hypothetical protein